MGGGGAGCVCVCVCLPTFVCVFAWLMPVWSREILFAYWTRPSLKFNANLRFKLSFGYYYYYYYQLFIWLIVLTEIVFMVMERVCGINSEFVLTLMTSRDPNSYHAKSEFVSGIRVRIRYIRFSEIRVRIREPNPYPKSVSKRPPNPYQIYESLRTILHQWVVKSIVL